MLHRNQIEISNSIVEIEVYSFNLKVLKSSGLEKSRWLTTLQPIFDRKSQIEKFTLILLAMVEVFVFALI